MKIVVHLENGSVLTSEELEDTYEDMNDLLRIVTGAKGLSGGQINFEWAGNCRIFIPAHRIMYAYILRDDDEPTNKETT
jgi:hypothetical protein